MYSCERCGKGLQVGMNVSHSHRRTKKRALPNLHLTSIYIGGKRVTARYCTKCLRIMHAAYPFTAPKVDSVEVKEIKPASSAARGEETPKAKVKETKEEVPVETLLEEAVPAS